MQNYPYTIPEWDKKTKIFISISIRKVLAIKYLSQRYELNQNKKSSTKSDILSTLI